MALQNPLLPVIQDPEQTLPPAPVAGISINPTDIERVGRSLDNSASEDTWAMYASVWRSFQAWAKVQGALAMPASPLLVTTHQSELAVKHDPAVATIRLHRAAQAAIREAPTGNEGDSQALHGIA